MKILALILCVSYFLIGCSSEEEQNIPRDSVEATPIKAQIKTTNKSPQKNMRVVKVPPKVNKQPKTLSSNLKKTYNRTTKSLSSDFNKLTSGLAKSFSRGVSRSDIVGNWCDATKKNQLEFHEVGTGFVTLDKETTRDHNYIFWKDFKWRISQQKLIIYYTSETVLRNNEIVRSKDLSKTVKVSLKNSGKLKLEGLIFRKN